MTSPRVIVITGASSGIGRATAQAFAKDGAHLVLAARGAEALQLVAGECARSGAEVIAVPTDVSREQDVQALTDAALARFGRIDVWVGAAGTFSYGTFEQTPPETFRSLIETNLMGQVYGARAVLPVFRRQHGGTLILVGSIFSRVGAPLVSAYATSKFGVLGLAEVLRQEMRAERGIQIRAVLPATIDTPIYQHAANYTGRDVHPLPPVVAPTRVARAIVRSVNRRRAVVAVGRTQGATALLRAVSPWAYDTLMITLVRVLGLRGRGVPASDGTVFDGVTAGGGSVTGGWRSPALRTVGYGAGAVAVVAAMVAARGYAGRVR